MAVSHGMLRKIFPAEVDMETSQLGKPLVRIWDCLARAFRGMVLGAARSSECQAWKIDRALFFDALAVFKMMKND